MCAGSNYFQNNSTMLFPISQWFWTFSILICKTVNIHRYNPSEDTHKNAFRSTIKKKKKDGKNNWSTPQMSIYMHRVIQWNTTHHEMNELQIHITIKTEYIQYDSMYTKFKTHNPKPHIV